MACFRPRDASQQMTRRPLIAGVGKSLIGLSLACFVCESMVGPSVVAQSVSLTPQPSPTAVAHRRDKALSLLPETLALANAEEHLIGKALAFLEIGTVYAKLGNKERAVELLTEADRIMQPIESLPDGLSKNLVLVPLATCYIEAGETDRAERILDGIIQQYEELATDKDPEWRRRAADNEAGWLIQLGPLYLVVGKEQKALTLIARNHERLRNVDQRLYRDRGLEQTALAYAALGKRELALEIIKTVKPGMEHEEGLSKIAVAYAQAGELDKAFELARTVSDVSRNLTDLIWIARKGVEAGRNARALALVQGLARQFKNNLKREEKRYENSHPSGDIPAAWAIVGAYEIALREAKRDQSRAAQLSTLTTLAPIFFKGGRNRNARDLLLRATALIKPSVWAPSQAGDLQRVAEAFAAIGQKEDAAKLLSRAVDLMKPLGVEPPNNLILKDIALTYARVGMAEQAIVTAGLLTDKYDRASTLTAIASVELGFTFESDPRLQPFGPLPPR